MNNQPKQIIVDAEICLVKYYPYYSRTLLWYQDLDLCKQVDNIDYPYDLDRLKRMYKFLSQKGECYYIKYHNRLVGDISLTDNVIGMAIDKPFQNMHIGRRSFMAILLRAKELGIKEIFLEVYVFNKQCQKMIESFGFQKIDSEHYKKSID